MINSTLGAPFGGTTRGGHHDVDSEAFSLITPPNFGSGGGSCFPVMVVVASGEPGVPVICCANAGTSARMVKVAAEIASACIFMTNPPPMRSANSRDQLSVSQEVQGGCANAQARILYSSTWPRDSGPDRAAALCSTAINR